MAHKNFAIVCDSTCDLPSELTARLEVVVIPLGVSLGDETYLDGDRDDDAYAALERPRAAPEVVKPEVEQVAAVYRALARRGYETIATVHSSLALTGIWPLAEQAVAELAGNVRVKAVDAGAVSAAMGMVVERLACARDAGMPFDEAVACARELARSTRLLFIPTAGASFALDVAARRHRLPFAAKASGLRLRLAGERSLFLLSRGEYTALARSADLADLCGRMAHAMSSVAAQDGELVYAVVDGGSSRAVRTAEKPLDTNEFCSLRLGHTHCSPSIVANIGVGSVAVAFAPKSVYLRAGASAPPAQHDDR